MKTKVLPVNYTDDLEKIMKEEKCIAVGIEEMTITYTQPPDTWSDSDDIQSLTVKANCADCCRTEDAEKKDGFYFDITIPEGTHWSVDDGEELKALIDDFKKRLYIINEFNSEQHEEEH